MKPNKLIAALIITTALFLPAAARAQAINGSLHTVTNDYNQRFYQRNAQIWPEVARQQQARFGLPLNPNYGFYDYANQKIPRGSIEISIAGTLDGCDHGANSFSASISRSICPGRIVISTGTGAPSVTQSTLCAVFLIDEDMRQQFPHERYHTSYSYDPAQRTITFRTIMNGAQDPVCNRTVNIR